MPAVVTLPTVIAGAAAVPLPVTCSPAWVGLSAVVNPDTSACASASEPPSATAWPEIVTEELASALFGTAASRAFGSVPEVMLVALVVSVVADAASPDTSAAASASEPPSATAWPEIVTEELASALFGTAASRAFGSVPEVMLVALVVSVVADAASPDTSAAASASEPPSATAWPEIVTEELASALFGTAASRAFGSVPEVMLVALVVSVVADAASPDTSAAASASEPPSATAWPEIVTEELASALFGTAASRAFGSVPEVMLVALVVSVVADAASPDTSAAASASEPPSATAWPEIVTEELASALFGTAASRAFGSVPEVMLVALVVSVVAAAASPAFGSVPEVMLVASVGRRDADAKRHGSSAASSAGEPPSATAW